MRFHIKSKTDLERLGDKEACYSQRDSKSRRTLYEHMMFDQSYLTMLDAGHLESQVLPDALLVALHAYRQIFQSTRQSDENLYMSAVSHGVEYESVDRTICEKWQITPGLIETIEDEFKSCCTRCL